MAAYVGRAKTAARFAKKAVPVGMELYRRWQAMPPEQRERYMKTVRDYAARAGEAAKAASRTSGKKKR
jgi:acyl-CoA reductase-like NAD-dependent aldehyde dehydrogenase